MRRIELWTVEDINVLTVDGKNIGFDFTKAETNLMLDDLVATQKSLASGRRSRDELLRELVTKTLEHCYARCPLDGGRLTAEETSEAIRLVAKACKKGWF
jgi:hypothetical protein